MQPSDLLIYAFLKEEAKQPRTILNPSNPHNHIEAIIESEVIDETMFATKKESIENFLIWLDDNLEKCLASTTNNAEPPSSTTTICSITDKVDDNSNADENKHSIRCIYDRLSTLGPSAIPMIAKAFRGKLESRTNDLLPRATYSLNCICAKLCDYYGWHKQHGLHAKFTACDFHLKQTFEAKRLRKNMKTLTLVLYQSLRRRFSD